MKYFHIGVQIEEGGRYHAYTIKVASSSNLLARLKIKNITSANIYPTKKEAEETVKMWNDTHIAEGRHMFWDASGKARSGQ